MNPFHTHPVLRYILKNPPFYVYVFQVRQIEITYNLHEDHVQFNRLVSSRMHGRRSCGHTWAESVKVDFKNCPLLLSSRHQNLNV